MNILYGHRPRPLSLRATRKYFPEEIEDQMDMLRRGQQPLYLQVENERLRLSEVEFRLAAAVAVSYHNQIAYNAPPQDEWGEETIGMEEAARARAVDGARDERE